MSTEKVNMTLDISEISVKKKGYTIDELRYQRALITLQKEFCKEKLINACHTTLSAAPWSKKKSGKHTLPSGLIGALLKGLSYSDYLMMGFSVFKTAKSLFSFFKRKKKS